MATKKALWSVLSYPESSELEKFLEAVLVAGGACMYILHDKDTTQDNLPKKPHFHIACGWAKKAPDWSTFVAIMKEFGIVCPGKQGRHDPSSAKVHEPDSLADYFAHTDPKSKADPHKHEYGVDSLCYSGAWDVSEYTTYLDKRNAASQIRKQQRQEDASVCAEFFDLIRSRDLPEFHLLIDLVCSQYPEKLGDLLSNAYPIKSYIDSRRMYQRTLCEAQKRINALDDELIKVRKELTKLEEENAHLLERNLFLAESARLAFSQRADDVPTLWEV